MDDEIVWLKEERRPAILVSRGAFFSVIRYITNGIEYEVDVENDDYEFWEERAFDFESE